MKWDSGFSWDSGWSWDEDEDSSYPEGGAGYGGDPYTQKFIRHNVPPSLMAGKARLFVQCAYGAQRSDLNILLGYGLQNSVEIGGIRCTYTFGETFVLYTDDAGVYWALYLDNADGASIAQCGFACSSAVSKLRSDINFSGSQAFDEERNQKEAYALAYLRQTEDPVSLAGTFVDTSSFGSPYFYGWKPNWKGNEGYAVLVVTEQTSGTPTYAKRSRVMKYELSDSGVAQEDDEDFDDYVARRFSITFTVDSTSDLWDFRGLDGVFAPDGSSGQNYKAGHAECFPGGSETSGSFPVYCFYDSEDVLKTFYYSYEDSYANSSVDNSITCPYGGSTFEYYCGCDKSVCVDIYSKSTRTLGKFVVDAVEVGGISSDTFSMDMDFRKSFDAAYASWGCSGWGTGYMYNNLTGCCWGGMYEGLSPPTALQAYTQMASYCGSLGMPVPDSWNRWKYSKTERWVTEFSTGEVSYAWLILPWFNSEGVYLFSNVTVNATEVDVEHWYYTGVSCAKQIGCYGGTGLCYLVDSSGGGYGGTGINVGPRPCSDSLDYIRQSWCCNCGNTNCGCGCCSSCTSAPPWCSEGSGFCYNYWSDGAGRINRPCRDCQCRGTSKDEAATVTHFFDEYNTTWQGGSLVTHETSSGCGLTWEREVTWVGKKTTETAEQSSGHIGTIEWSPSCGADPGDTEITEDCAYWQAWGSWYEYFTVTTCGASPNDSCPGIACLESVGGNLNGYGTPNGSTKLYNGYDEYTTYACFVGWD